MAIVLSKNLRNLQSRQFISRILGNSVNVVRNISYKVNVYGGELTDELADPYLTQRSSEALDDFTSSTNYNPELTPLLFSKTVSLEEHDYNVNSAAFTYQEDYRGAGPALVTGKFYIEFTGVASWFEIIFKRDSEQVTLDDTAIVGVVSRIRKGGHFEFEDSLNSPSGSITRGQLIIPF